MYKQLIINLITRCNQVCKFNVHSSSDLVVCYIPLHYGIFASLLPDHQIWLQTYLILNIDHPEFYSLLLDCLLYLHFIFRALLLLKFTTFSPSL